ncbi:MAG TPA: hypothetical protein VFZ34_16680, partial [Blastocatellia bacterium]|nr:hypothetical protein [Blastocatellia bacterium]
QQEFASRVAAADASIRSYLQPAEECLWGEEVAAEEGWTRAENWWYYEFPKNASAELLYDLTGA